MPSAGGIAITLLAFIVVITIVVVVHEGGHYVVAKLSGIRVDEFAVGFGPRLFSFRRGETIYAVRALPFGGFVKMPGMIGLEGEADAGERNFNRASNPRRAATIVAGVVSNLILGGICLSIAAGQPYQSTVIPGDPAGRAGLVSGDVIVSEGGRTIDSSSPHSTTASFQAADQASGGRPVPVVYRSPDGQQHTTLVTPQLILFPNVSTGPLPSSLRGTGVGLAVTSVDGSHPGTGNPATVLGGGGSVTVSGHADGATTLSFSSVEISGVRDGDGSQSGYTAAWRIGYSAPLPSEPLPQALADGFGGIPRYLGGLGSVIGQLFVQPSQAVGQLSGPVGIAEAAGSAVQLGWVQFVYFIGLISLSLGFANVLPIPFLDGGRLLFIGIEAVMRRRIDPMRQAAAIAISLIFIILVMVLITINDISHPSGGLH